MKLIRIGVVGAGIVSEGYHLPVLSKIQDVKLCWIYDIDESKAKRVAKIFKTQPYSHAIEQLPKVDIVLLAVPIGVRKALIEFFSRCKTHIFLEKPVASNIEDHNELINIVKKDRLQVGTGFMRRSYYSTLTLKKIVQSGIFGKIKKISASEGSISRGLSMENSFYQNDPGLSGGGILIETGSHIIDQIFYITSSNGTEIKDLMMKTEGGIDLETIINARVNSIIQDSAFDFDLYLSRINDTPNKICITFEKNTIVTKTLPDSKTFIIDSNKDEICNIEFSLENAAWEIYQAFYYEWRLFIDQTKNLDNDIFCVTKSKFVTEFIDDAYKINKTR